MNLKQAFERFNFEFRPECHREIDLAKKLSVSLMIMLVAQG